MAIVISGANGKLGRRVAELVLETVEPKRVVLVSRRPDDLASFAAAGVNVRFGDFDRPETLPRAFEGGDRLLLISTDSLGRRVAQHRTAISAAVAEGIGHIAYSSMIRPEPAHPSGLWAAEHRETETALRGDSGAGVAWTILRNGCYTEEELRGWTQAVQSDHLVSNGAAGRVAYVSRDDCAAVAAAVLTGTGHAGRIYEVTGPQALTRAEIVSLLGELSGRVLQVQEIGDETMIRAYEGAGIPESFARLLTSIGEAVRAGYYEEVTSAVLDITGRPPRTVREVIMANRDVLAAPAN
jgi:NAD(P)H dehydrogenase (quinone)